MEGWILLHKKIWKNKVVIKDMDHLGVWIYLLTNAEYTDVEKRFNGRLVTIHPGQLITGRKIIAEETGIPETKVRRIIEKFKEYKQIDIIPGNKGSIITILAWQKYQTQGKKGKKKVTNKPPSNDQQTDQQTTNKPTNKLTIVDNSPTQVKSTYTKGNEMRFNQQINQQTDQQMTNKSPKNDQQTATYKINKEIKEINNQINIYSKNNAELAGMTIKDYIKARVHGEPVPVRKGLKNADRAGMSIKDYIKAKGELK